MKRIILLWGLTAIASLPPDGQAATTIYTERPSFENQLRTVIVDDYDSAGYLAGDRSDEGAIDVFSDLAMGAVLGETQYTTTGHAENNIIFLRTVPDSSGSGRAYCAGCNGSFRMMFASTTLSAGGGIFAVGFDVGESAGEILVIDSDPDTGEPTVTDQSPYVATITFTDSNIAVFSLPEYSFFGVTSTSGIASIDIGLNPPDIVTTEGVFYLDNLTIGAAAPVPLPATLWSLASAIVATGAFRWRRNPNKQGWSSWLRQ